MYLSPILNEDDYLRQVDAMIDGFYLQEQYPRVWSYYQELCEEFRLICAKQEQTLFKNLRTLLRLDAQLQIIKTFFQKDRAHLEFLTELDVLKMLQVDKDCYYRELTGLKKNVSPPIGLIYLSEQ